MRPSVRQEPGILLRVGVRLCPRIMASIGIDGEPGVPAALAECRYHLCRPPQGHDNIFGAMKGPHWQVPNGAHAGGVATATDRGNGGTAVRISKRKRPGAETAHTQAGDIDPLRID